MKKIITFIQQKLTKKELLIFGGVTVFFIIWMLFFDGNSWSAHKIIESELEKLNEEKEFYQSEIEKDKEQLKELHQIDGIEKYAREKYYMKRDSEDIYIIEFKEVDK